MTIADVERRTTTEHATILWRVRRVAWHRFTRQYRRSLVITQGLVIAGVAIALPLYLQVVGYDVPGRESTLGRELPPDTETALSWALWTTQLGTFAAAAIVAALVGIRLLSQIRTPAEHWRRVPVATVWITVIGGLWALSSIITSVVIVHGLGIR